MSIDLMAPRIKVEADYPNNPFSVGSVLNLTKDRNGNYFYWYVEHDGFVKMYQREFEEYPHLFKELAWYEEREEKDMPEYVKVINDYDDLKKGQIIKPVKWLKDAGDDPYFITESDNVGYNAYVVLPATKEQYEEYL